ncbi:MAG: DNA adenine methylase [Deltaproteobacteria bacterium]|nr:DNA adenine methylase [Deltaproteobacteria bacterium]
MNPAFAYYGGKAGLARTIVSLFPSHRVYIEPFAGSLSVLFAKKPAQHEIVNDLDEAIVNFYRVLRDRPDELGRACELSPHSRTEFYRADCDAADVDDLERARRWFVRVTQSFSKTGKLSSGWSVSSHRSHPLSIGTLNKIARFAQVAERLRTVTLECCDATDIVRRLATPDAVVYVDPPYVPSTRASRVKRASDYHIEMDDAGHIRLSEALRATPATVVVSGYPSALYDQLYGDWQRVDFQVFASSSNHSRSDRGHRTEVLWSNRPFAVGPLFAARGAA